MEQLALMAGIIVEDAQPSIIGDLYRQEFSVKTNLNKKLWNDDRVLIASEFANDDTRYKSSSMSAQGLKLKVVPTEAGEQEGQPVLVNLNADGAFYIFGYSFDSITHQAASQGFFETHMYLFYNNELQELNRSAYETPLDYNGSVKKYAINSPRSFVATIGDYFTIDFYISAKTVELKKPSSAAGTGFLVLRGSVEVPVMPPPDLAVTQPTWNTTQGGVDFGYTVSGANLSQSTTAALYWSADDKFDAGQDTLIPGSVTTTQTVARTDPYPIHISAATLGTPPAGAKYLLAIVDPSNTIAESDESNNSFARKSNLSGLAWLQAAGVSQVAGQGAYQNSDRVEDLDPSFRTNVEAFIKALEDAGASVSIQSTRRSAERAYLMHWSWMIVHGDNQPGHPAIPVKPSKVPAYPGIDIQWDYGDDALSKQAAQQIISFFGQTNYAALTSRHIQGLAIDMQVSWTGVLWIKNKSGRRIPISSGPRNANNRILADVVASTYGVHRLFKDNAPHWSSDGR